MCRLWLVLGCTGTPSLKYSLKYTKSNETRQPHQVIVNWLSWGFMAVNPLGLCTAWAVYFTTFFLDRPNPLKQLTSTCSHPCSRNWQLCFLNQQKGENDRWKYFMTKLHECCQTWRGSNPHKVTVLVIILWPFFFFRGISFIAPHKSI